MDNKQSNKKTLLGIFCLVMAALIWGLAFVAQSSAADTIGSFTFNGIRSVLASVFLFLIIIFRTLSSKHKKGASSDNTSAAARKGGLKKDIIAGVVCGLVIFVAVNFQQFGIAAYPPEAASSGRAAFLTTTYVIMISLFEILTGKKLRPNVIVAVALCIVGMYLLCLSDGLSGIYMGDFLSLLCALSFAAHILVIDSYSERNGLIISCVQFAVCGGLSLIAMLIFEKPDMNMILAAWVQILYAGIFSSGLGYTFQIIGQKFVKPTVASIVLSNESVFAAVFGWAILGERLGTGELIGCVLVFASVILAQVSGIAFKKRIAAKKEKSKE